MWSAEEPCQPEVDNSGKMKEESLLQLVCSRDPQDLAQLGVETKDKKERVKMIIKWIVCSEVQ